MVTLLSPLVGTISSSHIVNSEDLVTKLCNLNLSYKFDLISFDVKSLFTNVPLDDILDFLSEYLNNFTFCLSTSQIIDLLKLCTKESVFSFNGNFYRQTFGLAMGNPLSPVLSNLYMEYFETHLLPNILASNVKWFRYIDDILCLWPSNIDHAQFLTQLNSLVPSIKFSVELENNCKLPFLDVLIHKTIPNLQFQVYRKPTNINSFVHFYSGHSLSIKRGIFHGMFLRALKIVSLQFINSEYSNIFEIVKTQISR